MPHERPHTARTRLALLRSNIVILIRREITHIVLITCISWWDNAAHRLKERKSLEIASSGALVRALKGLLHHLQVRIAVPVPIPEHVVLEELVAVVLHVAGGVGVDFCVVGPVHSEHHHLRCG